MQVIWTKHAEERQREWEKKRGVTRKDVEVLVTSPEQVVPGDRGISVAQTISGHGLLRVAFVESGGARKVVTVYWTRSVERYWKGGRDADPV